MISIKVSDKYEFILDEDGNVSCLRRGEPWINEFSHGTNAISQLVYLTHNIQNKMCDANKYEDILSDVNRRLSLSTKTISRVTHLLRNALPEDKQVGYGIDGMIESLLALLVGKQAEIDNLHNQLGDNK